MGQVMTVGRAKYDRAAAWDRVLAAWLEFCIAWRATGGTDDELARHLAHVGDSVGRRGRRAPEPVRNTRPSPTQERINAD